MAARLTPAQLLRLARQGAAAVVQELRDEIASIERAFPGLGRQKRGRGPAGDGPRKRRRGWNAAQRKAAADRMKAYWAKRRKKA